MSKHSRAISPYRPVIRPYDHRSSRTMDGIGFANSELSVDLVRVIDMMHDTTKARCRRVDDQREWR